MFHNNRHSFTARNLWEVPLGRRPRDMVDSNSLTSCKKCNCGVCSLAVRWRGGKVLIPNRRFYGMQKKKRVYSRMLGKQEIRGGIKRRKQQTDSADSKPKCSSRKEKRQRIESQYWGVSKPQRFSCLIPTKDIWQLRSCLITVIRIERRVTVICRLHLQSHLQQQRLYTCRRSPASIKYCDWGFCPLKSVGCRGIFLFNTLKAN